MNSIPQSLSGVPVIISRPIKVEKKVIRNWYERLLTTPFRPFTKFRITYEFVETLEDGQIIKMDTGLFMNAKTFNDCEKAILEKNTDKEFSTIRI